MSFKIKAHYQPAGDQPNAIKNLVKGLNRGLEHQILLGVTGSGKTFTTANVIAQSGLPTLVIAHNKTLAAQLTQEFRTFFLIMRSSTLYLITTTTSQKLIWLVPILILKRKLILTTK